MLNKRAVISSWLNIHHDKALPAAHDFPTAPQKLDPNRGTAESIANLLKVTHPRTAWDKDHKPDPEKDISDYFERLHPRYRETVAMLADQIPPMHPDCLLSICIPVAARDESGYIYRTLEAFTQQSTPRSAIEIVPFLNMPFDSTGSKHDRITDEISCFKLDYPDMPVMVTSAELAHPTVQTIGFIRSVATDIALWRHSERKSPNDHILLRCDADTRGVDRDYCFNYLKRFRVNPNVDAYKGRIFWSPEKALSNPLLYFDLVFNNILMLSIEKYNNRRFASGPNFAIRASMYAYIGGYNERDTFAEDCTLGESLIKLRADSEEFVAIRRGGWHSRLYTSSRRAEAAISHGHCTASQWLSDLTKFRLSDPTIRGECSEVAVRTDKDWNGIDLRSELERLITLTLDLYSSRIPGFSAYSRPVSKALGLYFGLDYEIKDETTVKVLDDTEFLRRWQFFCAHGMDGINQRLLHHESH